MKKNLILFIILLFSLLSLFGCGSFRKKTGSEKVKEIGNIAGIVFDGSSGEPLSGTSIYIEEMPVIRTTSDSLGRFWLSSVSLGDYRIWVEKDGFPINRRISHLRVAQDLTSLVVFRVYPSAHPEDNLRWIPWTEKKIAIDSADFFKNYSKKLLRKKNPGNIAGIVYNKSTGEPLAGAWVYLKELEMKITKSDSLGRFWLSQVPVGDYQLVGSQITFYAAKISGVKVTPDFTSLVLIGLTITAIPEHDWYPAEWRDEIIKTDSVSFFNTRYKNLLKKK
jgi:hypothetical protein